VPADLPKVSPNRFSLIRASVHYDTVNNRLGRIPNCKGQPFPALKSKWGLERVQVYAVKNFEILSKIQKKVTNLRIYSDRFPNLDLSILTTFRPIQSGYTVSF